MDSHRTGYKSWRKTSQKFVSSYSIFEECGLDNCFIELLESKECNSRDELLQLEGKYIRELDCVNKIIVGRTVKEYREDNQEQISEQRKQYRENNKENTKEYAKQYYEENREQLAEKQKQYQQINKERISDRDSKKIDCECGKSYTHAHKARHFKTIRHCQFIESQITKPEDDEV